MGRATQEFRVLCARPAGGLDRDPERPRMAEEVRLAYCKGEGDDEETRRAGAIEHAKRFMEPLGYDKFVAVRTIADGARAERSGIPEEEFDPWTAQFVGL